MDQFCAAAVFVLLVGFVSGCSIPEGGFVDPGIEGMVYYSDIVAVGTVTGIIQDPSIWGSFVENTTYGATVVIWCSYKGEELPRIITIGEAGYIPGMCFANDLELNEEYILFLHRFPGYEYYIQVDQAVPVSRLNELKNVCGLDLKYPTGPGIGFEMCPNPTTAPPPDCLQYNAPQWSEVEDESEDDTDRWWPDDID